MDPAVALPLEPMGWRLVRPLERERGKGEYRYTEVVEDHPAFRDEEVEYYVPPGPWSLDHMEVLRQQSVDDLWAERRAGGRAPLQTRIGHRVRPFCDGAGRCSPGRWPPEQRKLRRIPAFAELMEKVVSDWDLEKRFLAGSQMDPPFQENPIPPGARRAFQVGAQKILRKVLGREVKIEPEEGCVYLTDLMSGLLEAHGDPDYRFPPLLQRGPDAKGGLPMGVECRMPRNPSLFPAKRKFNLPEWDGEHEQFGRNAAGLQGHEEDARTRFQEDWEKGWVAYVLDEASGEKRPLTDAEAEFLLGPHQPGRVGWRDEGLNPDGTRKFRIVFDATIPVHANDRIRLADQVEQPGLHDMIVVMAHAKRHALEIMWLIVDYKGAHRTLPCRLRDWMYQVARLGADENYPNKVMTFGLTPASYWWARMAGCMHRLVYYLVCRVVWGLIYADDANWRLVASRWIQEGARILLATTCCEAPISFVKLVCATRAVWIGYDLDGKRFLTGVPVKRVRKIADLTLQVISADTRLEKILGTDVERLVGMLNHALAAIPLLRCLLGPLYTWLGKESMARRGMKRHAGPGLRLVLRVILWHLLHQRWYRPAILRGTPNEDYVRRTDAFAEGLPEGGQVGIGGWWGWRWINNRSEVDGWFSERLPRDVAPWMYGNPKGLCTRIASGEMFANGIPFVARAGATGSGEKATVASSGTYLPAELAATDNLGNAYIISKGLTTKQPLSGVFIWFTGLAVEAGVVPVVHHCVREDNEWADELSKLLPQELIELGYPEAKRFRPDLKALCSQVTSWVDREALPEEFRHLGLDLRGAPAALGGGACLQGGHPADVSSEAP